MTLRTIVVALTPYVGVVPWAAFTRHTGIVEWSEPRAPRGAIAGGRQRTCLFPSGVPLVTAGSAGFRLPRVWLPVTMLASVTSRTEMARCLPILVLRRIALPTCWLRRSHSLNVEERSGTWSRR